MKRFYRAAILKQPIGSAIQYKEPEMQGEVVVKVTDSTTGGDYKLLVINCDDDQHQTNLSRQGVEELSEDLAIELAARYQPQRRLTKFNFLTRQEETITIPACDLKKWVS